MNPNLCMMCETVFHHRMKTKRLEISATILFADVRVDRHRSATPGLAFSTRRDIPRRPVPTSAIRG
jgi:hypothetical protein